MEMVIILENPTARHTRAQCGFSFRVLSMWTRARYQQSTPLTAKASIGNQLRHACTCRSTYRRAQARQKGVHAQHLDRGEAVGRT